MNLVDILVMFVMNLVDILVMFVMNLVDIQYELVLYLPFGILLLGAMALFEVFVQNGK